MPPCKVRKEGGKGEKEGQKVGLFCSMSRKKKKEKRGGTGLPWDCVINFHEESEEGRKKTTPALPWN